MRFGGNQIFKYSVIVQYVQEALMVECPVRTEERRFLVVTTNVKNLQIEQTTSRLTFRWRHTPFRNNK